MEKKLLDEWTSEEIRCGRNCASAWKSFFESRAKPFARAGGLEHTKITAAARVNVALERHEKELLSLPNVAGTATSFRQKGGEVQDEICLTVFVERKVPAREIGSSAVPAKIGGVRTDVVEIGDLVPLDAEARASTETAADTASKAGDESDSNDDEWLSFGDRVRPAMPGYSIGHGRVTAGTFGCLVRDLDTHQHLILGNNHVLAATNRGHKGDSILQPGPIDGGRCKKDKLAKLERFEEIRFGLDDEIYNLVDAAVARPLSGREITASVIGSLMPHDVGQAFLGDRVLKAGRTTGVTEGWVIGVNASVKVRYPDSDGPVKEAFFRHQILTTFMSRGGDSGSLLMDGHLNAVGLIFAGSPSVTVANHIADVEAALSVRTLTAPRPGAMEESLAGTKPKDGGKGEPAPAPPPPDDPPYEPHGALFAQPRWAV